MQTTARYFADNGFAVFSADYRYNTDVGWPGQRDDAIAQSLLLPLFQYPPCRMSSAGCGAVASYQ